MTPITRLYNVLSMFFLFVCHKLNKLHNFRKLSSLRKALEEANQKDGEMTEKEEQKLDPEAQTTRPVLTSTTSVQLVNDSDEEEDEVCFFFNNFPTMLCTFLASAFLQLIDEVRRAFLSQIKSAPNISIMNPSSSTSTENNESHYNKIYEILAMQNHRLTQLYDQVCSYFCCGSFPSSFNPKKTGIFSQLFLAKPKKVQIFSKRWRFKRLLLFN